MHGRAIALLKPQAITSLTVERQTLTDSTNGYLERSNPSITLAPGRWWLVDSQIKTVSNHVIGGEGWSKKQMPNLNRRVLPKKGRGNAQDTQTYSAVC